MNVPILENSRHFLQGEVFYSPFRTLSTLLTCLGKSKLDILLNITTSDPDHPAELQAAVARGEDGHQRVRRLERRGDQHQPRQHRRE